MGKVLDFKPKLELVLLEYRRNKLLKLKNSMNDNCSLKEWFEVSNNIRKIDRQIQEIRYVRRYSAND